MNDDIETNDPLIAKVIEALKNITHLTSPMPLSFNITLQASSSEAIQQELETILKNFGKFKPRFWNFHFSNEEAAQYYFNQENLQEAYKEPTGSVVDFIKAVFDKYKFPTKKERIEDVYSSWLRQKNFTPEQTRLLAQLRDRFVAGDEKIDAEDFTKPPFSDQGGLQLAISLFGEENLIEVLDELSETIFI